MSLFVSKYGSSLNAQRQLFTSKIHLATAFDGVASGFRNNSIKGLAPGLRLSGRITSHIIHKARTLLMGQAYLRRQTATQLSPG